MRPPASFGHARTWIDRFVAFEPRKSAVAVKSLSLAEDHFADHFPGFPVMPATSLLEGLAQTGGILVGHANNFEERRSGEDVGKFHRDASAGEQLTYTATLLDLNDTGAGYRARSPAADGPVAEAEIMFAHVAPSQLPPDARHEVRLHRPARPPAAASGDQSRRTVSSGRHQHQKVRLMTAPHPPAPVL